MTPLYYEAHVTIEPIFGDRLNEVSEICEKYQFKLAKLLMQKDRTHNTQRSDKDSFCTGHAKDFDALKARMYGLANDLADRDIQVWRVKIESILLDEKTKARVAS